MDESGSVSNSKQGTAQKGQTDVNDIGVEIADNKDKKATDQKDQIADSEYDDEE